MGYIGKAQTIYGAGDFFVNKNLPNYVGYIIGDRYGGTGYFNTLKNNGIALFVSQHYYYNVTSGNIIVPSPWEILFSGTQSSLRFTFGYRLLKAGDNTINLPYYSGQNSTDPISTFVLIFENVSAIGAKSSAQATYTAATLTTHPQSQPITTTKNNSVVANLVGVASGLSTVNTYGNSAVHLNFNTYSNISNNNALTYAGGFAKDYYRIAYTSTYYYTNNYVSSGAGSYSDVIPNTGTTIGTTYYAMNLGATLYWASLTVELLASETIPSNTNNLNGSGIWKIKDNYNYQKETSKGSISYTQAGTYTFTVPRGARSINAVCIGGGGGGTQGSTYGGGGGGGGLRYINGLTVNPGDTITVVVGAGATVGAINTKNDGGASYLQYKGNIVVQADGGQGGAAAAVTGGTGGGGTATGAGPFGGTIGGGNGGAGGNGSSAYGGGGGGAGGYSGNGGAGGNVNGAGNAGTGGGGGGGGGGANYGGGGGGTGIISVVSNGTAGVYAAAGGGGGSNGGNGSNSDLPQQRYSNGGHPGGGGGGTNAAYVTNSSSGGTGAVRIVWGTNTDYPNNSQI